MPDFTWDAAAGRYRESTTGRFAPRSDITGMITARGEVAKERIGGYTRALNSGQITPGQWETRMRREVKRAYIQSASLGSGGIQRVDARVRTGVSGQLRDQFGYLRKFRGEIDAGLVPSEARAQSYGLSARSAFYGNDAGLRAESLYHWVPTSGNPCALCQGYADGGPYRGDQLPAVPGAVHITCSCGTEETL